MAQERLQVVLQLVAGQYKSEAKQAASATGQVGKSATAAGTATGGLGAKMAKVQGSMLAIGAGALVAKKGFDATIGAFANFDAQMNESLAIMGDVSDEMRQEMSDAAREVAKTTTFSAEQAAEAYFFLASAGMDAAAAVEAMPQVAQFAQAGMFDMATATDLATDAQSALGLASDDASQNLANLTRVTDVFVKANTLANTSVQQVSEAMTTKAGAAIRALGKDIEEGTAVLAAFADQGVKGAAAGTQFAIVLRDLQTKALANKNQFAEMNVAVFDANGEMRNMADIVGDLEGALDGMSDAEQKSTLLGLGFSDKSVAALTTLLGTSDAIRSYEQSLRDAGGTTEDVADNQLKSAKAQWELFLSTLQDVGLELGENTLPLLEDTIPLLHDMADSLNTISQLSGGFENPLPDDIDQRATEAAREMGFWERAIVSAGRAAAQFTPEGRQMAQQLSAATDVQRDALLHIDAATAAWENHTVAVHAGVTGYHEMVPMAESADRVLMNVAKRTGAAHVMKGVGDEARTAAPSVQDMANAIHAVHTRLLEITDPVFASVAAKGRFDDAQADLEELQSSGEATHEEIAAAKLAVAETAGEFAAAQTALEKSGLEKGVGGVATLLGEAHGNAEDLLEDVGILDEHGEIVIPVSFSMSAADRALLNQSNRSAPDPRGRQPVSGRAHGGPVTQGQPYVVGERGREMFVPETSGMVLSNADTRRLMSGSDTSSSGGETHLHFHGSGDGNADLGLAVTMAGVMRRVETSRR